jgi:DNA-binding PadR family transcriptional regulator
MTLRHVLLGLIVDQPAHAYSLKQRLAPGVPRDQLVNDGVLYPLLARLEKEDLVESVRERGEAGKPRRVYSATSAGRAEFRRWLRSDEDEGGPPMHEMFVAHPLVKLLFADHFSPDELQDKLRAHAESIAERIATLESLGSVAESRLGPAILKLELRHLRDQLVWLRRADRAIGQLSRLP